jgi:hypothetical protein
MKIKDKIKAPTEKAHLQKYSIPAGSSCLQNREYNFKLWHETGTKERHMKYRLVFQRSKQINAILLNHIAASTEFEIRLTKSHSRSGNPRLLSQLSCYSKSGSRCSIVADHVEVGEIRRGCHIAW